LALHALPAAFLAGVTVAALFARLPARAWRRWPFLLGFGLFLLLAVRGPYVLHFTEMFSQVSAFRWDGCYSTLDRSGCVPLDPNQQAAVEVVRARTGPEDYVFVANMRHDQIFVNDVLFYFLAARPIPTAYSELHPGLATTREVQQAIIADLEEKDVRWVVASQGFLSGEPNASAVNDLDEFIRENYYLVSSNTLYHILHR